LIELASLLARVTLIGAMFGYGFEKVVPLQFPFPGPVELAMPLQEWTRHEFLWRAWMGISQHYQIFAGLAEVTAGLLLIFRRTTTFGALLVMAEMANVAVLNFTTGTSDIGEGHELVLGIASSVFPACYFLLAAILVFLDWPRVVNLFVRNAATKSSPRAEPVGFRPWLRVSVITVWAALVLLIAQRNELTLNEYLDMVNVCPLGGVYEVEQFARTNGATGAEAARTRWRQIAIDRYCQNVVIRTLEDSTKKYLAPFSGTGPFPVGRRKSRADELSKKEGTLTLMWLDMHLPFDQPRPRYALKYSRPSPDVLTLDGVVGKDTVHAVLRKRPMERYALFDLNAK
jgi:hypothetical protein